MKTLDIIQNESFIWELNKAEKYLVRLKIQFSLLRGKTRKDLCNLFSFHCTCYSNYIVLNAIFYIGFWIWTVYVNFQSWNNPSCLHLILFLYLEALLTAFVVFHKADKIDFAKTIFTLKIITFRIKTLILIFHLF